MKPILMILVFLSVVMPVMSFEIINMSETLVAQDCTFLSTDTSCGGTISYRCLIQNSYAVPGTTSVKYVFRRTADNSEVSVDGQLVEGQSSYGYYQGNLVISPLAYEGTDGYTLKTMEVKSLSNSATCTHQYTDPITSSTPGCEIRRDPTGGISKTITCTCGTGAVYGACGINDQQVVSYPVESQCSGLSTNGTQDCDYCDPQWLAYYAPETGGCYLDRTSATMAGQGSMEYLHGFGTTPGGHYCCGLTKPYRGTTYFNHNDRTASDCIAPYGSVSDYVVTVPNSSCQLDAWLGRGKSPDSYNVEIKDTVAGLNFGAPSFFKINSKPTGTSKIQPLVADFDGDGVNEIFNYQINNLYMYNVRKDTNYMDPDNPVGSLVLDYSNQKAGIQFFGQPAVVGLSYKDQLPEKGLDGSGTYKCSDGGYPPCGGLMIAIFGTNLTDMKRTLYVLNASKSGFDVVKSYVPEVSGDYIEVALDSGVSCSMDGVTNVCYYSGWRNSDSNIYMCLYKLNTNTVDCKKLTTYPLFG